MLRVEIIANHSVEENLLEAFSQEEVGKFYTKYSSVFGVGNSGPRMGDAVWPEENFSLIIWCEEEEARGIVRAVAAVKKQFPDEGIRIFGIPAESNRFPHVAEYNWAPQAVHVEGGASVRTVVQVPVQPAAVPAATPQPAAAPPAEPAAPAHTPPPAAAPPPTPQPPQQTAAAQPAYAPPEQPPAPPPVYAPDPAPEPAPDSTIGKEYDGQNMEN